MKCSIRQGNAKFKRLFNLSPEKCLYYFKNEKQTTSGQRSYSSTIECCKVLLHSTIQVLNKYPPILYHVTLYHPIK